MENNLNTIDGLIARLKELKEETGGDCPINVCIFDKNTEIPLRIATLSKRFRSSKNKDEICMTLYRTDSHNWLFNVLEK